MTTLALPELVAGRDFADDLIDTLGPIAGQPVVVDASDTFSGTASFAAGLVERLLVREDAADITLAAAPEKFARYVQSAAAELGVTDRVRLADRMPATA